MKRPHSTSSSLSLWDLPIELILTIFWFVFRDFESDLDTYKSLFRLECVSKKFGEYVMAFANLAEYVPIGIHFTEEIGPPMGCNTCGLTDKTWKERTEKYHPKLLPENMKTLTDTYFIPIDDSRLSLCVNVTCLTLSKTKVSDDGLRFLTRLTRLNLYEKSQITGSGINAQNIQKLFVNTDHFNLSYLKSYQNLVKLELGCSLYIKQEDYEHLENLTQLKALLIPSAYGPRVPEKRITDRVLQSLTGLTILDISSCVNITDRGLSLLTNLTTLACNANITEFGLSPLLNLVNLKRWEKPRMGGTTRLSRVVY